MGIVAADYSDNSKKCRRGDSQLMYMVPVALAAEFALGESR